MPRLPVPEVHLPELRLPEMSRDDITRALNEARRDVDLEMPQVDVPKLDLSKVEMPKIDLSKIDLSKIDLPKAVVTAAQAAGIAKRPTRWPLIVGALVTVAVVGFALATSPMFRPRLEAMARRARQVIDERRGIRTEPVAFDATPTAPIQPSAWSDDAPVSGSPYDGPGELPEGLGSETPSVREATTA
jgi:hypothetical protein